MDKRTNTILKIKNLLKLAEDSGATPAEAAAAMGRAQHLMDRYKIDAVMAEGFDDEPIEEIRDWNDPLDTMAGRSMPTWLGRLAVKIAKANGCQVYQSVGNDGRKTLNIIGGASDATAARYLYKWIRRQIEEMAGDYAGNGRTWLNNWRLGVVETVGHRLKEGRAEAVRATVADGHALVVVENAVAKIDARADEAARWGRVNLGLSRGGHAQSRYDGGARAQGRRDGNSIGLTGGGKAQLS